MMILNGRTNGDYFGRITHYNKNQGSSTVNIAMVSCNIYKYINSFMVLPQLDISDHCKILIKLTNTVKTKKDQDENKKDYKWLELPKTFQWSKDNQETFKKILNEDAHIENIITEAEQRLEAGLIESTGEKIQDIFIKTAELSLPKRKTGNHKKANKRGKKKKKWFDQECVSLKNRVS